MIEEKYLEILDSLKYKNSFHSLRKFSTHLIGTYKILDRWGNREEVCLAGLFHSIYGTVAFKKSSLDVNNRALLEAKIGHKAEELVYLFCVSDRKFIEQSKEKDKTVFDRVKKIRIKVSDSVFKGLIEIEAANLIEQGPFLIFNRKRTKRFAKKLLEEGEKYLSNGAQNELKKFIKSKVFWQF